MNQNEQVAQLSSKQAKFVEARLAGESLEEAAETARISYSTAKRWQVLPHVHDALKSGQRELFDASLEQLKRLMPKAVDTLEKHLDSAVMVTSATQLGAARQTSLACCSV